MQAKMSSLHGLCVLHTAAELQTHREDPYLAHEQFHDTKPSLPNVSLEFPHRNATRDRRARARASIVVVILVIA